MKSSERKKDLKAKAPAELQKELMDLLSVQFKLRMQKSTQQLTNTSQIRRTRRVMSAAAVAKTMNALNTRGERSICSSRPAIE